MNDPLVRPDDYTKVLDLAPLYPAPQQPLEVDVGCGKGRFLCARAQRLSNVNFLGIDRMMSRLLKLEKKLRRLRLHNARLLHLEASYIVAYMLPPESVSMFHVFFPDPWPKRRHRRRRLFSEAFLAALHRVLVPGGRINIATDHADYFEEIQKLMHADPRYREAPPFEPLAEERTDFEMIFTTKGVRIGRSSFEKKEA